MLQLIIHLFSCPTVTLCVYAPWYDYCATGATGYTTKNASSKYYTILDYTTNLYYYNITSLPCLTLIFEQYLHLLTPPWKHCVRTMARIWYELA